MGKWTAGMLAALLAGGALAGDLGQLVSEGKAALDLRYRYENVEQDGLPQTAEANTLRLRLNLSTGVISNFSALAEIDHLQVVGNEQFNDTRNGRTSHPVVADPGGTDLNQAFIQYRGGETLVRAGRQRISLDGERFVGAVGWRQNEQTYDALLVETRALQGAALSYAYVDTVRRVFGPDAGNPAATFSGGSHLLNLKLTGLPVGALTFYDYYMDFDEATQLSTNTAGVRYDGSRKLDGDFTFGWAAEYARQQATADNTTGIDAGYWLLELGLKYRAFGVTAGREVLGGERGTYAAARNPAFQTPLATLHKFQGWADKFLTTPSAGIEDTYVAFSGSFRGFNGQVAWHDFSAEATGADYGTELDVSLGRRFADRYDLLLKYADYSAAGLYTDTRKFWLQLAASF